MTNPDLRPGGPDRRLPAAVLGNGSLLATVSTRGEVERMFWPHVDRGQHLGELRLGIFSEDRAVWLDPTFESCGGYGFVWGRDLAYTTLALLAAGRDAEAAAALRWLARVQAPEGLWLQRYCSDGLLGPSWGLHQIDETGAILFAYEAAYAELTDHALDRELWLSARRAAEFLLSFLDPVSGLPLPSVDLWEQDDGERSYSSAAVGAGLRAAARMARRHDPAVAWRYEQAAARVADAIERHLWSDKDKRYLRSRWVAPGGGARGAPGAVRAPAPVPEPHRLGRHRPRRAGRRLASRARLAVRCGRPRLAAHAGNRRGDRAGAPDRKRRSPALRGRPVRGRERLGAGDALARPPLPADRRRRALPALHRVGGARRRRSACSRSRWPRTGRPPGSSRSAGATRCSCWRRGPSSQRSPCRQSARNSSPSWTGRGAPPAARCPRRSASRPRG